VKCQVAKGRVSCHASQKAMLDQQRLQIVAPSAIRAKGKQTSSFDDRVRFRPQLADDPEQAFAYPPVNPRSPRRHV